MSDTINALTQAARSSSILDAIAHPAVVNPLAAMNAGDAACTGAPHGAGNGMWKHGRRSIEVIERRRAMTAEMRRIRREISAGLR